MKRKDLAEEAKKGTLFELGRDKKHVDEDALKQAVLDETGGTASEWIGEHLSKKTGKAQVRHTEKNHNQPEEMDHQYWAAR